MSSVRVRAVDPAAALGRRDWLARATSAAAAAVALAISDRPARAHHGFVGSYDFSRPLYLAGTVESLWIGQPHARLALRQDPGLVLPRDRERFRALEDAESRQMLQRLRLVEQSRVEIALQSRLTRLLMADPEVLTVGLHTELIGYRRTTRDEYRHEIVGVWLRLGDGRVLVASTASAGRPRRSARD